MHKYPGLKDYQCQSVWVLFWLQPFQVPILSTCSFRTKFPDDPRFRVYKVYKKFKMSSFSVWNPEREPVKTTFRIRKIRTSIVLGNNNITRFLFLTRLLLKQSCPSWLQLWGGERTKAGTKTAAGGEISSATGKKALGEALDPLVAEMKADIKGKDKQPKTTKTTKTVSETKALQKDIKSFLT